MSSFAQHKVIDDEYYTTKEIWGQISHLLPKDKVIWEPFYGDGQSGKHLRDLGFQVIHEDIDFFKYDLGDIIVSNPPFSKKTEVFQRLFDLGKPFVMIMGSGFLPSAGAEMFREHLQIVIPDRSKLTFDRPPKLLGENGPTKNNFDTFFYFWKMNLPRDMIFLDPPPGSRKRVKKAPIPQPLTNLIKCLENQPLESSLDTGSNMM